MSVRSLGKAASSLHSGAFHSIPICNGKKRSEISISIVLKERYIHFDVLEYWNETCEERNLSSMRI